MGKKIAVVLSGCGFRDGAEITEAVSALIHLSELGAEYRVFAPDLEFEAVDHLNGSPIGKRNALHEAARIARGQIQPLSELREPQFDGLVLPGGYGAALNLCQFGKSGHQADVLPEMKKILRDFHAASKPICAICIAPALVALCLKDSGSTLTIGQDEATAQEIRKTGNEHEDCPVTDFVTDRENKLITTPAYMYDAKPHQVFKGIQGAIRELYEMA